MHLDALLWLFLPVFVAGGSALLSFYIMQAKMEVSLSKERESLAEAHATISSQKVMMEERIRATEESVKRAALDEFLKDFRVEERSYVRETKSLESEKRSMIMQERLFFRNIPLSDWVEHEMVVEVGSDLKRLQEQASVFGGASLPAGSHAGLAGGLSMNDGAAADLETPGQYDPGSSGGTSQVQLADPGACRVRGPVSLASNPFPHDLRLNGIMGLMAGPALAARTETGQLRDLTADFTAWMASEQRRVFGLCLRLLQDPDEADSATQDVFLKAYTALSKEALRKEDARVLDDPARWVTRIAVNTCLDRLRSQRWRFWRRRPSQQDEQLILSWPRPPARRRRTGISRVRFGRVWKRRWRSFRRASGRHSLCGTTRI